MLAPSVVRELLAIRDDINALSVETARDADTMVGQLIDEYGQALFVLTLSTVGFVGAGLVLVLLVGRASMDHHRQWRRAQEARDLLQETLEALPAGVVVYDRDERLVLFNGVAASITPSLQRPDSIGRPYEDMVRETARLMEEAGAGRQPWEVWLGYFRSKNKRRLRQALDGRWFEWSEKLTPSGRTVGLRFDVTEARGRESELERERARYRRLVDSLSDTVFTVDKGGVVTFVSAAVHELLGLPPEQIAGRRLREFVAPEDVDRALAEARSHYQSTDLGVRQIHLRMRRHNGATRHVEIRSRKPAGEEGPEAALVGIIRDVTERVDLAERLRQQMAEVELARADYQSLVDSVSDAVFKADAKSGVISFVSAAAAEVMGVPPAKLIGMRTYDHMHVDDVEYVMAATKTGLKGKNTGVVQIQYRVRTPAGEVKHVETRMRKTPGPDGRSLVVGVVRDIEERVRLSQRLEAETTRLRSIVESSGALIVLTDRDLEIVMVNSGFTAVTGITAEAAVGRPLKQVIDCPLDERVLDAWRAMPQGMQTATPVRFVNTLSDAQGRKRLISVTATPAADVRGHFNAIVFLGVDDTERSEAEQALFAVERLSTVGEMAATMAHEINQPLQVINLACESAKDELDDAADRGSHADPAFVRSKLDRITQQLDRASRIVGELRAFVRGTGADEPERPFDAAESVRAAIELMAVPLQRQGTIVSLSRAEQTPPIKGHIGKLEQVLVNLINNARDAGARSIDVSVTAVGREGPHRFVCIAIDDDGPGIAADILPRLFVAFVTTKERGKGTGFGLRICRRIVEEMGGTITARNRSEGGARFEIVIPATS
jgi:PAS domain S-box-containing protein